MAISIVSDLVLDVVKAANPERARIAQAGLQRGQSVASAAQEFADAENTVKRNPGIGRFLVNGHCGRCRERGQPGKTRRTALPSLPDPPMPRAWTWQAWC